MKKNRSKPYNIGFFTTGTNFEFSTLIARAITQAAKEHNINLIHFIGGSLNPNFSFSQYKYQYQCNVAFDFAKATSLDGIILASNILASFISTQEFYAFYSNFNSIPMVSLGSYLPDLPSVYTDNKDTFYHLVSHLIKVHNRKKIAFISGPENNINAFNRHLGYISALTENHIKYDSNYVYTGDFTPESGKKAIATLLDDRKLHIDAIVCANDDMALAILSELKKRHIIVPTDMMLTGCDNTPSSAYCVPSLTSIHQPIYEMSKTAIDLLLQCINGHHPKNVIIPSQIIFRDSCDCNTLDYRSIMLPTASISNSLQSIQLADTFLQNFETNLPQELISLIRNFVIHCYQLVLSDSVTLDRPEALVQAFLQPIRYLLTTIHLVCHLKNCILTLKRDLVHLCNHIDTICYLEAVFCQITHELLNYLLDYYSLQTEHLNQNFSFTRQFLLTITHNVSNKKQQLQSIIPSLKESGITSCLIYLYPEGITHNFSNAWQIPNEIYLYMSYVDQKILYSEELPLKVSASELPFFGFENKKEPYTACVHPIFFDNEQLGIMVFEMGIENYSLIDNLVLELGCALKLTSTFTTQRQIENKLETLSQTDELTGLLNRRGFFNLAQAQYDTSCNLKQNGILFFADMDGLKYINDTYGHDEGDYAIVTMSQILKETFSNEAIIGRIGGDEFVILVTNEETNYIETITHKVNQLCETFNNKQHKHYLLSISIGSALYPNPNSDSLESLLSQADRMLYDIKKLKQ